MSSKPSKTPEAAQKKIWNTELKQLNRDLLRSQRETAAKLRAIRRDVAKLERQDERLICAQLRTNTKIARRMGILHGRLGV